MPGRSGGGPSRGGGSRGGGSLGSRGSSGRSMGSRGSSGRSFSSSGPNRPRSSSSGGFSGGFGGMGGGPRPGGRDPFFGAPPRPPRHHRPPRHLNSGSFLGGYILGRNSNRRYNSGYGIPNTPYDSPRRRSSGCLTVFLVLVAFVVILNFIGLFSYNNNTSTNNNSSTNVNVTSNTVKREPLAKGNVIETKYYEDKLGWIHKESTLVTGLKNFYNLTGIQPYILLIDTVGNNPREEDIEAFLNDYYDSHFKDEAHLLFAYIEDIDYMHGIVGSQGLTIIDQEAWDIIFDHVEKYWNSNMDEDELFSRAFDEAATSIMSDPNAKTKMKTDVGKIFIIVVGVIIIFAIIKQINKSRIEQKKKEAQDLKDILDKPLESFKDSEMDDLTKKYDK